MSAIASFYVVPAERLTDIVAAAVPARGESSRPQDDFGLVLRQSSRAVEVFAWSGSAFNALDLYLETRHGFMFDRFGDPGASATLTQARGSYWLVLQQPAAAALLTRLAAVPDDPDDLPAFLRDEHGTDEVAGEAIAVAAALATLEAWLAEIPPGAVGLLSIA